MPDDRKQGPGAAPGGALRSTPEELREQQAIAAAMLIGEESRREERVRQFWWIQRAGVAAAVFSFIALLILFAYSRIRQDFSPTFWMVVFSALGAGGIAAAYWAYVEGRRA